MVGCRPPLLRFLTRFDCPLQQNGVVDKRPSMAAHAGAATTACNGDDAKGASSAAAAPPPASTRPSDEKTGKYKLLGTLGKGNFAKVKLAVHTLTNERVNP